MLRYVCPYAKVPRFATEEEALGVFTSIFVYVYVLD